MKNILFMLILASMPILLLAQPGITNDEKCVSCIKNEVDLKIGASALGAENVSTGVNSIAAGFQNNATGNYSLATGYQGSSTGESSIAMGYQSKASGDYSLALGKKTHASGKWANAFGIGAKAIGNNSFALGPYTTTLNTADISMAIGSQVTTAAENSMVIGFGAYNDSIVNDIENSLMIGFNSDMPTFFVGTSAGPGTLGKIGIGTTEPSKLLEVNGTFKVNDFSYMNTIDMGNSDIKNIDELQGNGGLKFKGTSTGSTQMTLTTDGKLGIGTTSPNEKLEVDGNILQSSGFYLATSQIKAPDATGLILSDQNGDGITIIEGGYTSIGTLATSNYRLAIGGDLFATGQVTSSSLKSNQLEAYNSAGLMLTNQNGNGIFIDDDGNVGIATTNIQDGYILTIDGKVMAEEVLIQNSDTWYDFVFDESYNLPTLTELDTYIKQNKHLPDVPTAEEVAENGYNLGEMNGILLKKVEELTLYVIEQQKEIEKLKEKTGSLQ